MDITTLTGAQQGIKALFGLAKLATSAAVDHVVKDKLIEIQEGILDAQGRLGDAVAERLDLLHENAELREKVRSFEASKAALDEYALEELAPGAFVYRAKLGGTHSLAHHACPTCYSAGRVMILQSNKTGSVQVRHQCAACGFKLYVGKSDPIPNRPLMGTARPRDW